jgi:hypothetical protein
MTDDLNTRHGWRRALGLFGLAFVTSVAPPGALVAVPLLVLIGLGGIRSFGLFVLTVSAMVFAMMGPRDGLWYVERGWALMAGGAFAALSLGVPSWRLTTRTLASVAATVVASAVLLGVRADAWATLDWQMGDRLRGGFATWVDAMEVLRGGEPVPAATVTAAFTTAEALVAVFPAVLALESMAALGVAWWIYLRFVHHRGDGLGPLGGFRFNDHLVWVMIVGLVLVGVRTDDGLTRLGANLAVFMGALYALRGVSVVSFVSGGLSFVRASLLALGFVFAAPVVIGFAVLLGIADTWLDVRERVGAEAA